MNFRWKGHELFVSQMSDQIWLACEKNQTIVTFFLTVSEQEIVKSLAGNKISVKFDGGSEHSERKVAIFSWNEAACSDVVCLKSKYDSRFKTLKHPDVLGALMNLGIERNQLGDLIVEDDFVYIFTKESMADYIASSCLQIGKCKMDFHREYDVSFSHSNREPIQIQVASVRLDCIVAALAHCSRSKANDKIRQGFVKVNDIVLDESVNLCNNDFVSIRRVGRFQFLEVVSKTKKGRFNLRFDHFK